MPGNKYIQSALARAVIDVGYLDMLGDARPGDHPLPATDTDTLAHIRNFSAFISRVQHNFLLAEYPLTFRLLEKFHFANDVFKAYLGSHQRLKKAKATNQQKEESFIAFLDAFLRQQTSRRHGLLLDALSHEVALKKLRDKQMLGTGNTDGQITDGPPTDAQPADFTIDAPAHINGCYETVVLHCSPDALAAAEATGSLQKLRYAKQERMYCYWLETSRLEHFEITAPLQALFSRVDGRTTIREIAGGKKNSAPQAGVIQLFRAMYEMRFIYFTNPAI